MQDSNSYNEESKSGSLGLDYNFGTGEVGITGGYSEGNIDSNYASVTDQSGIYAGDEGFDIYVEDNTDLKGGIISGDNSEENKLSTGTLTYEDIKNEAEYEAGSTGVNVNIDNGADYNEKGVTPNIGMPAEDEAESTTKATVSEGEIEIRDKENQKQDLAGLNRDTQNSLNKLGEIFDKDSIEERQELAGLFGELAYNQIHFMEGTDEQKAAYHALVGGIMAELTNGDFLAGASAAAVNKMISDKIIEAANGDPAMAQWLSAAVGAVVSEVARGNAQSGANIAASGMKNNDYGKAPEYEGAFKKVGDKWYKYINGQYVETDEEPLEGVPYWDENLDDIDMGYDYIRGDGDYSSDKYEPRKVEYSWYVNIDGEAWGFTIFDENDRTKKMIIRKGLEQYAYAVARGTTAKEVESMVKFAKEYEENPNKQSVYNYILTLIDNKARGPLLNITKGTY